MAFDAVLLKNRLDVSVHDGRFLSVARLVAANESEARPQGPRKPKAARAASHGGVREPEWQRPHSLVKATGRSVVTVTSVYRVMIMRWLAMSFQ